MRKFPEPIQNAVAALSRLPGVGPKTALRYVYYLLKQSPADLKQMAQAFDTLSDSVKICPRCFTYTEYDLCEICRDGQRDPRILCVVEVSRDIATIESTGQFKGYYHVLGGTLSPIEGHTPDTLQIASLKARVESNKQINEIILALSPTIAGETTMLYLSKHLAPTNRRTTRLARGLPIGATIEYADEITLGDALKGRQVT